MQGSQDESVAIKIDSKTSQLKRLEVKDIPRQSNSAAIKFQIMWPEVSKIETVTLSTSHLVTVEGVGRLPNLKNLQVTER